MTHNATILALFAAFILISILVSEWAHKKESAQTFRPKLVRTIVIDTDTEIERQEGWE